jgi:hypothetical protein
MRKYRAVAGTLSGKGLSRAVIITFKFRTFFI